VGNGWERQARILSDRLAPKVKRILIWLDFAPRKASNLPNLRSEKRVCDHFQDYRGVQKRIIKAKRLALRPGKLRYSIGITGFI
jgi:hypothetical protein